MADLVGTILDGKYELTSMLGEGGMGTVYEATHKLIGRRLAVKFLHAQYVTSEEVITRFQREAQAAAAIGHENIIEVTDMGTGPDGAPYIVMEYLDGMDVKDLIGKEAVLSSTRAAHIMVQALSALHAAHQVGIIHRDLKPENIYLITKPDRPDYVKLLDFGISKFRSLEGEGSKGLTQTGTVLGTPYYMSPEQARGDQDISPRSDIYAMGVILYQMLTGDLPFDGPNYNALLIKILTEDPPPPESINPEIPPELVETINIAMSREPEDRFADCVEFRDRIVPFCPGSSNIKFDTALSPASKAAVKAALGTDTKTGTPLEMTRTGAGESKSKLPLILGAAAAVVLIAAGAFFLLKGGEEKPAPTPVPVAAPTPPPEPEKPAESEEAKEIQLKISATPIEAEIKIDGATVAGNPFEGPYPKDGELHKVEISADGYEPETADIRFDRDQAFSYKLAKAASTGRSGARRKKASSSGDGEKASSGSRRKVKIEKVEEDKPKRKKKPRRKIDDEDPWG